eukprot:c54122_g1_i1 orf=120-554(+)
MGDQIVSDALKKELEDAAQQSLGGVQDHVNFTLQRAYFKCGYECFDRRRSQREISDCVERCSVPVLRANSILENEVTKFQERLNRSFMVCHDRFESAKLANQWGGNPSQELEECVKTSAKEHIGSLPHLAERIRTQLAMETVDK